MIHIIKKIKPFHLPLLLVLLIFVIDKIALIPLVNENGQPPTTPLNNIRKVFLLSSDLYTEKTKNLQHKKPYVAILGSSRSEMFKYMSQKDIDNNQYLSSEQKQQLGSYYFETRTIIRAGDFFINYYILDVISKMKQPPAIVILEISPEMYNRNSPFNMDRYVYENILDYAFTLHLASRMKNEIASELILRSLFPSYNYKLSPAKFFKNTFFRNGDMSDLVQMAMLQNDNMNSLNPNHVDFEENSIPDAIYQERFLDYNQLLYTQGVLLDYQYNENEALLLQEIINKLTSLGVRVIGWVPKVHPVLFAEWKKMQYETILAPSLKYLQEHKIPVYRGDLQNQKCSRYTDSSHMSSRCSPYMMANILEHTTQ